MGLSSHLHLAGFNFIVLPDAFVVHIDHGVPKWRNNANKTRIWVNWYSFALEKEAELGGGGKKLFFAPKWWGEEDVNVLDETTRIGDVTDK